MVVTCTFTLGRVYNSLEDTIRQAKAYNAQSIPEAAHKNYMCHVPDPFKTKGKHNNPPKTGL